MELKCIIVVWFRVGVMGKDAVEGCFNSRQRSSSDRWETTWTRQLDNGRAVDWLQAAWWKPDDGRESDMKDSTCRGVEMTEGWIWQHDVHGVNGNGTRGEGMQAEVDVGSLGECVRIGMGKTTENRGKRRRGRRYMRAMSCMWGTSSDGRVGVRLHRVCGRKNTLRESYVEWGVANGWAAARKVCGW